MSIYCLHNLYMCKMLRVVVLCTAITACQGQNVGHEKKNVNPPLQLEECTGKEECTVVKTKVTMDQNWRWVHDVNGYENCYTGNQWDSGKCPDPETCSRNCAVDGIDDTDWKGTYGVKTDGKEMQLNFVTQGPYSKNIGQRLFLLDENEEEYRMFHLKNREFTMDVDVSQLGCGLNGAVYFVEMDADGGKSKYPPNKAGAAYGTGYCDAQCPHDLKFINGEPNIIDWKPSEVDGNAGTGHYGSCCNELDIWEANSISTAYTIHPCFTKGPERCEGLDCGDNASGNRYDGVCDKDGCDFHTWRMGNQTFFGPNGEFAVDTSKPMTVVTQFITHDGTDTGDLVEMRRLYVQNGNVIHNSFSNVNGIDRTDSVNDKMCDQTKEAFKDYPDFQEKGGMKAFGDAMDNGMVLVLSLWGDFEAHMLWLDSSYPLDRDPSEPGVNRGPCSMDSGNPDDLVEDVPDAYVKFSKLRVGTLGSTYPSGNDDIPTTTVTPDNNCPGGSLDKCISMCPTTPSFVYAGCVKECAKLC